MSHLTCVSVTSATSADGTHRRDAASSSGGGRADLRTAHLRTAGRRSTTAHPAARSHLVLVGDPVERPDLGDDDGSLVAEYGLLAVVAATVAGVLISWAGSGALASFFGQLLDHARSLVVS